MDFAFHYIWWNPWKGRRAEREKAGNVLILGRYLVKGKIVPEPDRETNSETLSSQGKRRKAEKEKQENIWEGEKWLRADGNLNRLIVGLK